MWHADMGLLWDDSRMRQNQTYSSNSQESRERVDIATIVNNTDKLVILARPWIRLYRIIDRVRRWEAPMVSVIVLLVHNTSCLLLATGYYLLLTLSVIALLASFGYTHMKTNILAKVFSSPTIAHEQSLYNNATDSHDDVLRRFKLVLVHTNTLVKWSTQTLTKIYAILKWEDMYLSIGFYLALCLLVTSLHTLPLRWTICLLLDFFLLEHTVEKYFIDIYTKLREYREKNVGNIPATTSSSGFISSSTDSNSVSQTNVNSSCGDPAEAAEQDNNSDSDMSEKLADTSWSAEDQANLADDDALSLKQCPETAPGKDDTSQDTASVREANARARPGVVGKLLEFRKRQQAAAGSCVSCGVNFTTILKRRHLCSHCGNHFCAKCCSRKIPKAMFGATAPGAQTETVAVCNFCYTYLTATKDKTS